MSASAAVARLKVGVDEILRVALQQHNRPQQSQVPQAEQERLAAVALAAARDVDDVFERAKLACTAETEDEVKREVWRALRWRRVYVCLCVCVGVCKRAFVRAHMCARE